MTSCRRALYAGIAAAVLTSAGVYPAYAYVCHPDPPGTRSLTVGGTVARYSMNGARVSVDYRARGSCTRVSWSVRSGDARSRSIGCAKRAPAVRTATHVGARLVTIRSGAIDEPDRLVVRKNGRVVRAWPLPDRFRALDAYGDLALLGTRNSRETYAVRLSDGRAALVALNHRGDSPQIEAPGIVYQDNVLKRHESAARRVVKFVPMRAVERAVNRAGRPLTVEGEIADLAMDGARVAIAVHGLASRVRSRDVLERSLALRLAADRGGRAHVSADAWAGADRPCRRWRNRSRVGDDRGRDRASFVGDDRRLR